MARANGNGEAGTRTTTLLTQAARGLQLTLTALMFMSLLLLRIPSVNPLSMMSNRILRMRVKTLITNKKRLMTALAASMTTIPTRGLA